METIFSFVALLIIGAWFFPSFVGQKTGESVGEGLIGLVKGVWQSVVAAFTGHGTGGSGEDSSQDVNHPIDQDGKDVPQSHYWFDADSDFAKYWALEPNASSGLRNGSLRERKFGDTQQPFNSVRNGGFLGIGSRLSRDDVGRLVVRSSRSSAGQVGRAGVWYLPDHSDIRYVDGDKLVKTVYFQGDPRFLALLMVLCHLSGEWKWNHVGLGREGVASGVTSDDDLHVAGTAIDWHVSSADALNGLLRPCYQHNVPVAWISSQKTGGVWPMFQIRGGKKVLFAHSSKSHATHFCFQMPRSEFAMDVVPWERA
jgi:hypothetical protein